MVDVVVEQVAEIRDDAHRTGIVVVGPEHCRKVSVTIEGRPDPDEDVLMHLNVGIDEDEHVADRLPDAKIPRRGRTEPGGPVDDDQFLGSRRGSLNGADGTL